jgi:hypothetical protein
MSEMKEAARGSANPEARFRVIDGQVRERNRRRRPVAGPVDVEAMKGELMENPDGEFSASQKRLYGVLCREERARYGLTDGLRLDRGQFSEYLARRRAEDAKARGWG